MHVGAIGKQAIANIYRLRALATDGRHLHSVDNFDQMDKWARYTEMRVNKEYENV